MVYGYCRISTKKQNIERQERNIKQYNSSAVIIKEEFTGTTMHRKEWEKLFKAVKDTDTIIFDSVSRMSRNAEQGFEIYQELYNRGVNLVFLKEPQINTETYKTAFKNAVPMTNTAVDLILQGVNAYLLELAKEQIKIAFEQAEKEVEDLRQRTKEGIETARLNGKQIGVQSGTKRTTKKSTAAKETILKYSKDFNGTLKDTEVMKLAAVSKKTYYIYKAELKKDKGI